MNNFDNRINTTTKKNLPNKYTYTDYLQSCAVHEGGACTKIVCEGCGLPVGFSIYGSIAPTGTGYSTPEAGSPSYKNVITTIKNTNDGDIYHAIKKFTKTICHDYDFFINARILIDDFNAINWNDQDTSKKFFKLIGTTTVTATDLSYKDIIRRQIQKLMIVTDTFTSLNSYDEIIDKSDLYKNIYTDQGLLYQKLLEPIPLVDINPTHFNDKYKDVIKNNRWWTGIPKIPTNPIITDFSLTSAQEQNSQYYAWKIPPSEISTTRDSPALDQNNPNIEIFDVCKNSAGWKNMCMDYTYTPDKFGMVPGTLGVNFSGVEGSTDFGVWYDDGPWTWPLEAPACLNDVSFITSASTTTKGTKIPEHWQSATPEHTQPMPACAYMPNPNLSYDDSVLPNYKNTSTMSFLKPKDGTARNTCRDSNLFTSKGDNPNSPWDQNGRTTGCKGPIDTGWLGPGNVCLYAYSGTETGAPFCLLPKKNKYFPNGLSLSKDHKVPGDYKDLNYFCCTGTNGHPNSSSYGECVSNFGNESCNDKTNYTECIHTLDHGSGPWPPPGASPEGSCLESSGACRPLPNASGCKWIGGPSFTDKNTEWSNVDKQYGYLSPPNPSARMYYTSTIYTVPITGKDGHQRYYNNTSPLLICYVNTPEYPAGTRTLHHFRHGTRFPNFAFEGILRRTRDGGVAAVILDQKELSAISFAEAARPPKVPYCCNWYPEYRPGMIGWGLNPTSRNPNNIRGLNLELPERNQCRPQTGIGSDPDPVTGGCRYSPYDKGDQQQVRI